MAGAEQTIWGIHTTDDELFLKGNKLGIGWREVGDLSKIAQDRDSFKSKISQVFPESKKMAVSVVSGMLYRFCYEAKKGDYVVFPSKSDRMINIGIITGDYKFDPAQPEYSNTRTVKWLKHMKRTNFSQGALYETGSAMTFFAVKNYADEFLSALKGESVKPDGGDDTVGATADEIIQNTKDFVLKELSRSLKGYALEDFVANLLQAMGYRATVSPQGGDSGIDITAYKDELPPRILIQIKSQDSDIKETTIQSLKGAMREGDYGVFITLSDYTKNAKKYLANTPIIRGINGSELVDLVLKYYDVIDEKYQKIIPLKKAYIPVQDENGL